jgi:hypothetical protein
LGRLLGGKGSLTDVGPLGARDQRQKDLMAGKYVHPALSKISVGRGRCWYAAVLAPSRQIERPG